MYKNNFILKRNVSIIITNRYTGIRTSSYCHQHTENLELYIINQLL